MVTGFDPSVADMWSSLCSQVNRRQWYSDTMGKFNFWWGELHSLLWRKFPEGGPTLWHLDPWRNDKRIELIWPPNSRLDLRLMNLPNVICRHPNWWAGPDAYAERSGNQHYAIVCKGWIYHMFSTVHIVKSTIILPHHKRLGLDYRPHNNFFPTSSQG